ncbi:DUF4157 domain-containing protein [Microbacterium ureisolvens]|uniref:eCIS core domain-containing protein n=1 Tax=Microbacterium ureisolvens TaxID=2781186 RepID=UPI00363A78C2
MASAGRGRKPLLPASVPEVTPAVERHLESARGEGETLPAAQRAWIEDRLGHDFGRVRVHAGPAAAAAASALGAAAFTRDRDIFFGAGFYRPGSVSGRRLLAHELTHTTQERPGVISRQPLAAAEVEAPPAPAAETVGPLADNLLALLRTRAPGAAGLVRERLASLEPPVRMALLARVRSQLPPAGNVPVAGLLENLMADTGARPQGPPAQETGEAIPGGAAATAPLARAGAEASRASRPSGAVAPLPTRIAATSTDPRVPAPPATESAARDQAAAGEPPGSARGAASVVEAAEGSVELRSPGTQALPGANRVPEQAPSGAPTVSDAAAAPAAAAQDMQAAIRTVTGEGSGATTGSVATSGTETEDTTGAPIIPGAEKAADPADAAAQEATARMGEQLGEVAAMSGSRVRFQEADPGVLSDPAESSRREQSNSLATGFLGQVGGQVAPVLSSALSAVPQITAALADAIAAVEATTAQQVGVVRQAAETARRRIAAIARQARGHIDKERGETDSAADRGALGARNRVKAARKAADGDLDRQTKGAMDDVSTRYRQAEAPTRAVGARAGGEAKGAAARKAEDLRKLKNGESSVLDGPIHDDRLEARATAATQVGDGYAKSFAEAATEQAGKLPDSKPEVLGKITEISGQAKTGLDDQLRQMSSGIDAFERSAHQRSRTTGGRLASSATGSGKQAAEAVAADETQQTAGLAAYGASQKQGMIQAVAVGLRSLADGVTEAVGHLLGSMAEFTSSAAGQPPPEPEELSSVLGPVTGQAATGIAAMAEQVGTIGPRMAATLATSRDQGIGAMTDVGASAVDQAASTAGTFGRAMQGLRRSATRGFDTLRTADSRTAGGIGKDGEDGFQAAAKATRNSFTQFGEKVGEFLSKGRDQLFESLWSRKNQEQLEEAFKKYGDEAERAVKPRWKRVLKWVVTIVVILAVIAVTVVSAGALGPVGVVLLGAALGAAAGAVTTIAHNMIDGEKWSKGVAKAMIVGAIGGAFGGASGVLLKGVGSVALRIGLDAGINVVGGVTGEVVGSLAVGETINWTGALTGALIGAGVGAGLGIAGVLKGKIRPGTTPDVAAAPAPRAQVEVPPPAGRIGGALERAKILAPRQAPAMPAGATAGATGEGAPAQASEPRIGFGEQREAARAAQPRPGGAEPSTETIGFGREAQREVAAAQRAAQPRPAGAEPDAPRIGFGEDRAAARAARPRPAGAEPDAPRIGFGEDRAAARAAQPRPASAEPHVETIGFGRQPRPRPIAAEASTGPEAGLPAEARTTITARRPAVIEVGQPQGPSGAARGSTGGRAPELTAGGRAPEVAAGGRAPEVATGGRAPDVAAAPRAPEIVASARGVSGKGSGGSPGPRPGRGPTTTPEPQPTGRPTETPAAQPTAAEAGPANAARPRRRIVVSGEERAPARRAIDTPPVEEPSIRTPAADEAGSARRPGTNEPARPETGAGKEARELAADRLTRPPKGSTYFDYEGGARGSFKGFANRITRHFRGLARRGEIAAPPAVNRGVLDLNTEAFIASKPSLRAQWDGWGRRIAQRMDAIRRSNPDYLNDPRYKELLNFNDELARFGSGKVGNKRPDLVEVFPRQNRIEVTDITQKFGDEFHAFKTKFYRELLQDMFPAFKVAGVEFKGPLAQRIYE